MSIPVRLPLWSGASHAPRADIRAFAPATVVDIISEVAAITDLI